MLWWDITEFAVPFSGGVALMMIFFVSKSKERFAARQSRKNLSCLEQLPELIKVSGPLRLCSITRSEQVSDSRQTSLHLSGSGFDIKYTNLVSDLEIVEHVAITGRIISRTSITIINNVLYSLDHARCSMYRPVLSKTQVWALNHFMMVLRGYTTV